MSTERFNAYRIMWVFVFFDLPVVTKKEMRIANLFRKNLKRDGFTMFQYSIYTRCCASIENAEVHTKRVKSFLPETGHVVVFQITDRQFGLIEVFYQSKAKKAQTEPQQLELF